MNHTCWDCHIARALFPINWSRINFVLLYTGLVEQTDYIWFQEVDLAMAPLTTSVDRGRVVDFAYPFYYGYAGGVFKSPALKHKAMKTLLEPFQYTVFLCLAIVFVVLSIQLYLGEK